MHALPPKSKINLAELITLIHLGVLEKEPWTSFLQCLRLSLNADIAVLLLKRSTNNQPPIAFWSSRQTPYTEQVQRVSKAWREYGSLDPLINRLSQTSRPITIDQVMDRRDLLTSDFYKKVMVATGFDHYCGMSVGEDAPGYLLIMNGKGSDAFSEEMLSVLTALRPNLTHAIKMDSWIKRKKLIQKIYDDTLNQLKMGTVILDGSGQVIECNGAANTIFAQNVGISVQGNRVVVSPRYKEKFDKLLRGAIAAATFERKEFVEAMRMEGRSGEGVGLLIRAIKGTPGDSSGVSPCVILQFAELGKTKLFPPQIVAHLFGLTQSEARLVALLANGETLQSAASKLNITEHSVRTYSKKIFAKTGTKRQAELIRLVLKSVALLAPGLQADITS